MRLRLVLAFLILIVTTFSFSACSDDDPTSPGPVSDILLTIHFNEYNRHGFADEGIVFASDPSGNLLDVATWTPTSTVVLKNSDIHPEKISFTLFQHSDSNLSLTTQLGLQAGSVKTFSGLDIPALSGSADISFSNAPDCWQYRMAWNLHSVHGWDLFPSQRRINIRGEATDFFVRVDPVDADPVGGWLRDVRPGDTGTLDFEKPGEMAPLQANVARIPSDGDFVLCVLRGILETDPTGTPLPLDALLLEDTIPETITLYQPEFDPSNLISMYYQENEGFPETFYWQESTGPVPASFTNLEGELSITSTSPDSLVFSTSFPWDRLSAGWFQKKELTSSWRFEGPAPIQTFLLPQLPEEITDLYPEFLRGEYSLHYLEVYQTTTKNLVRSQGKIYPLNEGGSPDTMKFLDSKLGWRYLDRFAPCDTEF